MLTIGQAGIGSARVTTSAIASVERPIRTSPAVQWATANTMKGVEPSVQIV